MAMGNLMIGLVLTENSIQLVPDGTLLIHMTAIVIMVAVLMQRFSSRLIGFSPAEKGGAKDDLGRLRRY